MDKVLGDCKKAFTAIFEQANERLKSVRKGMWRSESDKVVFLLEFVVVEFVVVIGAGFQVQDGAVLVNFCCGWGTYS